MTLSDWKFFLLWVCLVLASVGRAQLISGRVASNDGLALPYSSVMIKTQKNGSVVLLYTMADSRGQFQLDISELVNKTKPDTLWLEISHIGFENYSDLVFVADKFLAHGPWMIKLTPAASIKLRQVEVQGKRPSFTAKKDTTVFRVDAFKDGSDRKLVDVIRKLPGVEIKEESGEIVYRGVSIETLTLDGDDLFGNNYVVGSKNINIDLVESIEGIENYTKNRVLKGLEGSGKTVLNVKLKKTKRKTNIGLDAGIGMFTDERLSMNSGVNVLSITKSIKSFGSFSYNNVGINNSPFNPLVGNITVDRLKNGTSDIHKVIADESMSSPFTNGRDRINNQFFITHSLFWRMSPKASLKANFHHAADRFSAIRRMEQAYLINNSAFATFDEAIMRMRPIQAKAEIDYRVDLSKSALLEVSSKIGRESFVQQSHTLQNGGLNVKSLLTSRDLYGRHSIVFSKRLSNSKAIQVSLKASMGAAPQTFTLSPSQAGSAFGIDTQLSKFRKASYEAMATLLRSSRSILLKFNHGLQYDIVPYISSLSNAVGMVAKNNLEYRRGTFFSSAVLQYEKGKWSVGGTASVKVMGQRLLDQPMGSPLSETLGIAEGNANITYRPKRMSAASFSAGRSQNSMVEQFLFTSRVLSGNRTTISNQPSLALQTTTRFGFSYRIDNLNKQVESDVEIDYSIRSGNFFSKLDINDRTVQIDYFFSAKNVKALSAYWKLAKYLHFLRSTAKLHISWSNSEFRNIVNQSEWRLNRMNSYMASFFFKTAFRGPVNMENKLAFEEMRSGAVGQAVFSNRSLENRFKVIGKIGQSFFVSGFVNYLKPDLSNNDLSFCFIDMDIRLKPTNKKWDVSLIFTNIANQKSFQIVRATDVSTTIFASNLRPLNAMAMLSVSL